nr:putative calcium-binding protein cml19 [Quercus suber]
MNKCSVYNRVFQHFDEDKDGKISALELCHCIESIGGGLLVEEVETVIKSLDSDGAGLLGLEDFVGLMESGSEEEKIKDLREAFEMYDTDGAECITPKSLKSMLSRLGESRTLEKCVVMINQFDLDGNGGCLILRSSRS